MGIILLLVIFFYWRAPVILPDHMVAVVDRTVCRQVFEIDPWQVGKLSNLIPNQHGVWMSAAVVSCAEVGLLDPFDEEE